jgi:alkaline phosphatase
MMKKLLLTFFTLTLLGSCAPELAEFSGKEGDDSAEEQAKNIILLLGNGMGVSQITAGLYHKKRLHLENFPVVGIHKPTSFDNLITDAAAGATAISCGIKTYNGALGVDSDTMRVTNIMEEADLKGYETGLLSSSSLTYPSLAAFYAHLPSSDDPELTASELLLSGIDLFIGGGADYFNLRSDERNFLELLKKKEYEVYKHFGSWKREIPDFSPENKIAFFTARQDPPSAREGRDYLPIAAQKAIEYLMARSQEKQGFFLVIESSHFDKGARNNDTETVIDEVLDFDKVVKVALDFAQSDGETLVLLTADHETGGFALNVGSTDQDLIGAFTTTEPTGTLLPVFAYGPGANRFSGMYENSAIPSKIKEALRLDLKSVILD